jgi:hypothetical protein
MRTHFTLTVSDELGDRTLKLNGVAVLVARLGLQDIANWKVGQLERFEITPAPDGRSVLYVQEGAKGQHYVLRTGAWVELQDEKHGHRWPVSTLGRFELVRVQDDPEPAPVYVPPSFRYRDVSGAERVLGEEDLQALRVAGYDLTRLAAIERVAELVPAA